MSIQPFKGPEVVVIEKRHADGTLDFSDPQPPTVSCDLCHHDTGVMTFDDVYKLFFREMPDGVGSWEQLKAWLDSKGWVLRAKTW